MRRLSKLFQELGRKSALACQDGSADDPWRGPFSAGSDSSSHLGRVSTCLPAPTLTIAVDADIGRPTYMWSDLVPPKQSVGFMPHCRNKMVGEGSWTRRRLVLSLPLTPPISLFCIFPPSFIIRYHGKCNGGYTPNLKPMRGARRKGSVPDYRCLAGLQTNGPSFFTTMLLSLLAPGSERTLFLGIRHLHRTTLVSAHSFSPITGTHHSNTPNNKIGDSIRKQDIGT